jgi:hypothetical protein
MAFGFKYKVCLVLTHPSMEAIDLTERLREFAPEIAISAGEIRTFKSGLTRPAALTVWQTNLVGDYIDSETAELNEFLISCLPSLRKHQDVFLDVNSGGDSRLEIEWRFSTTHSAGVLTPDVLKELGAIGLALDLEIYTSQEIAGQSQG